MLYIICGTPGSGKTTFAQKLVQEQKAVLFSLDEQTHKLYGAYDLCEIGIRERATKYQLLYDIFRLIDQDVSVVLDYGFFKEHERQFYQDLAKRTGVESKTYYVQCDYKTQLERVLERNKAPDNIHVIDQTILDNLIGQFEEPSGKDVIIVET